MDKPVTPLLGIDALAAADDFQLRSVRVSPSRRVVAGPAGERHLQPQVMTVFMCLADKAGEVVTRRALFDRCWAGAPVGDDSLNRTVTALRQALQAVGADGIEIETVPRAGYRLAVAGLAHLSERQAQAVEAAWDCWRLGQPRPDSGEIAELEAVLADVGGTAPDWGLLALLLRKAVEYADSPECADFVRRCERAARKALSQNPGEANARLALAGLTPLFGNWTTIRGELETILAAFPDHPVALHEKAVLEMATGRPSAAAPIVEQLLYADPLAATFHYKRMYHLWTLGDLKQAEVVAARALALWPHHPAIWMARFWTLLFTARAAQAMRLAADAQADAFLPAPLLGLLHRTAEISEATANGEDRAADVEAHVSAALGMAALGPAQAVAALMSLCALGADDEAMDIARGYYLGQGRAAPPMRWNAGDPSITDQHRRVTQPLFVPAGRCLRRHPRFPQLCDDIGLSAYWEQAGIVPDYLGEDG